MPTNRKRTARRATGPRLSKSLRMYLETGDMHAVLEKYGPRSPEPDPDCFATFQVMGLSIRRPDQREKLKALWLLHREEILRDWKREKKKGRPWLQKVFEKNIKN